MNAKKIIGLLLLFMASATLHAQDGQPYKKMGKKVKVLTLSKGKYSEFFDYDTIQRIGTVLYNTRTKKIVKLLNLDEVRRKSSDNSASSRWLSIDPLASRFMSWSPYNFVLNNPINLIDPDGRAPLTDYYNLNGKKVLHVDDGKTDKVLVLTTSKKEDDAKTAITAGNTMAVPSNEIVGKMADSYTKTEANGKESYFEVGQAGNSSKIVQSQDELVSANDRADARRDLIAKGDKYSYDVHTHPNVKDKDGNFTDIGSPKPSETDRTGTKDGVINVVLGYKQEVIPAPPSGPLGGTTSSTVNTYQQVGFHNNGGHIIDIKFKDFSDAVKKINKN